jgi:uncharacterized membrane protein (DUF373 family)
MQPMRNEHGEADKVIISLFSAAEKVIWVLIGLVLIVVVAFSLIAVYQDLVAHLGVAASSALIALQDIFTTIIVAELLITVLGYLKTRTIDLRLILGIGVTAMVRRLLVIGIEPFAFEELIIVVAATAVLVVAIKLVGDTKIYV